MLVGQVLRLTLSSVYRLVQSLNTRYTLLRYRPSGGLAYSNYKGRRKCHFGTWFGWMDEFLGVTVRWWRFQLGCPLSLFWQFKSLSNLKDRRLEEKTCKTTNKLEERKKSSAPLRNVLNKKHNFCFFSCLLWIPETAKTHKKIERNEIRKKKKKKKIKMERKQERRQPILVLFFWCVGGRSSVNDTQVYTSSMLLDCWLCTVLVWPRDANW